jgi:hypothetical protein
VVQQEAVASTMQPLLRPRLPQQLWRRHKLRQPLCHVEQGCLEAPALQGMAWVVCQLV